MFYFLFRLWKKISRVINTLFFKSLTGVKSIKIQGRVILPSGNKTKLFCGNNVSLYDGVTLWGGPINIGNNVSIGANTILASIGGGKISIGDNTIIAAQCYIINADHQFDKGRLIREQPHKVADISIGSDVWIAANVTILKGVKIGNGAVIGAKALVNTDIPDNAVAVGIPAKVIKYRV